MDDNLIATLTNEHSPTSWKKYFKHNKMEIFNYDLSWHILFSMIYKHPKFKTINKKLKDIVKRNVNIFPHPSHILSAFILTDANNLKVVFIGNAPYNTYDINENKISPHAMGLCYSVPNNTEIPDVLKNIFTNLLKYKHIKTIPQNGNLWYWAIQGCLMLNLSLTIDNNDKDNNNNNKQEHINIWGWMIDMIIQYISQYMENIIFVLWGHSAYKKINMIDLDKHHTIISSYPSNWAMNKKLNDYPAFMEYDHFGTINKILLKLGKEQIIWD
jgi:uracil-DNA glycosylase